MYVLGLSFRVCAGGRRPILAAARLLWSAGCLSFLLHAMAAFHFYHHWSHQAAYEATSRETAEVVGFDWGGGLYANYAFALLWVADAGWWWFAPDRYLSRPRWLEWTVQGYFGFIAFNATVVFGTGTIRWIGLGACMGLALVLGYSRQWHRLTASKPDDATDPGTPPDR